MRALIDAVTITGLDAGPLLDSQLSQDLSSTGVGSSAWSLLLEPDGQLVAWVRVVRESEWRWVLIGPRGGASAVAERLARFKLREKAEIVVDPVVVEIGTFADTDSSTVALPRLWSFGEEIERLLVGDEAEAPIDAFDELEARRIGSLRPGPDDLMAGDNPFAIGTDELARSVSFTKGCYTGQELVARMDARGANAPFRLAGFETQETCRPGEILEYEGAPVGTVRSVRPGGGAGLTIGICMLARKVPDADSSEVHLNGAVVRIRTLPLVG